MNKKILAIPAFIMLVGMAAATGFSVDKDVDVTGNWEWTGSNWQKGEFLTAGYNYDAKSPAATGAAYSEIEKSVGTPWKYGLTNYVTANTGGWAKSQVGVTTVNDPDTTPATDGYTQYKFQSNSNGDYTHSSLTVEGEGYASIDTTTHFTSGFNQDNFLNINNAW